ncbi:MAG: hypothetical protein ABIR47_14690 [Candidatus Kapaibacterium sp.]
MDVPILRPGQYSLLLAQVTTGHVLTIDGERPTGPVGWEEYYRIFDSFEEAEQYVNGIVSSRADLECHIYDADGAGVKTIYSFRSPPNPRVKQWRRPWWKFWARG